MSTRQSIASLELLFTTPISIDGADPSEDPIEFAFIAPGATPVDADWYDGSWRTTGGVWLGQVLIGGELVEDPPEDAVILDPGKYVVWVRVTDNPEIPARPIDVIVMFGEVPVP